MRLFWVVVCAGALSAQQPILYTHGSFNAASFAPFGLPNAPIARGSVFTITGENLGPAQGQTATAYPLAAQLAGVSISVTQKGVVTAALPMSVSARQVYALMPSSVKAGLATLRLTYQASRGNAITIQIADAAPGLFSVSGGGYGPGLIQNQLSADSSAAPAPPAPVTAIGGYGPDLLQDTLNTQPLNSLTNPAVTGQAITLWGTGLGASTAPDESVPTSDSFPSVTVSIGGVPATPTSAGRASCCAGLDQIVVTVPDAAPLGCWVPVIVKTGGGVSNTATMAIAAPGATSCDDPGNPLSQLVRTPGTQAFIHAERVDGIQNANAPTPVHKVIDNLYSRFYTRPDSPFNFDPYLSYPPAGACLVHQAAGDTFYDKTLRGALPSSASLTPQPNQSYSNGDQVISIVPQHAFFSSTIGGTIDSSPFALNLAVGNASLTIDPGGPDETALALNAEPPPAWMRPSTLLAVPRNQPLTLSFTPGDTLAPTAILLYSYAAATNSTVEVQCLAAPGANTFTIPSDALANLQPTYQIIDGSYATLSIGTQGVNNATSFSNGLAASGILLNSSWLSQSVELQ